MNDAQRQALTDGMLAGGRYTMAVPRNVPSGLAGMHLARNAGASLEFRDHREYQPGDDLRSIDWSAYARSDKVTVKIFREEVNPHLDVLIDGSRSMALDDTAKATATLGLAAALVGAAMNSSYTHHAYLARQGCEPIRNAGQPPDAWADIDIDGDQSLAESLVRLPPRWRSQGIRILLSDLLFMADPLTVMEQLSHGASAVYVVQVLADADANPPQRGNVRLVDCETGALQEVFVDAAAEKRYRDNLARHQQNWAGACRQVGAGMTTVIAERIVRDWDMTELLTARILNVA